MQASFRIRTQNEIKDILCDQSFENKDFYIDLISPWSISESKAKNSLHSTLTDFDIKNNYRPVKERSQTSQLIRKKYSRVKTEASKYLGQKHILISDEKQFFFNNFFPTNQICQKNNNFNAILKKSRQLFSRQKFKTPVVNLNEFSFHQGISQMGNSFLAKNALKQKLRIRPNKISGYRPYSKQNKKQHLNKQNSFNLKKFSTQKTISFSRQPQRLQQKKFHLQIQNYKAGHGTLMQNIQKLTMLASPEQPIIKNLKSRSLNKFHRTFY